MLGELQVVLRTGQPQHDAPVAGVPGEAVEFGQPEPVAVKADDLIEPVGGTREAHVRYRQLRRPGLGDHGGPHLRWLWSAAARTGAVSVPHGWCRRGPPVLPVTPLPPFIGAGVRPQPTLPPTTSEAPRP